MCCHVKRIIWQNTNEQTPHLQNEKQQNQLSKFTTKKSDQYRDIRTSNQLLVQLFMLKFKKLITLCMDVRLRRIFFFFT